MEIWPPRPIEVLWISKTYFDARCRRADSKGVGDGRRGRARRSLSLLRPRTLFAGPWRKDRHPFPVPLKVYDETISVMKSAVRKGRLGRDEELAALKRLDDQSRVLERYITGPDLKEIVAGEFDKSFSHGGRSVFGWEPASNSEDDDPAAKLHASKR